MFFANKFSSTFFINVLELLFSLFSSLRTQLEFLFRFSGLFFHLFTFLFPFRLYAKPSDSWTPFTFLRASPILFFHETK